jgi:hypothetical protein
MDVVRVTSDVKTSHSYLLNVSTLIGMKHGVHMT